MTTDAIQGLADEAMRIASTAAIDWLRTNGRWAWSKRLAEEAVPCIRRAIHEGLDDAREALDVMGDAGSRLAEATFRASLVLAGTEAAMAAAEPEGTPRPAAGDIVG